MHFQSLTLLLRSKGFREAHHPRAREPRSLGRLSLLQLKAVAVMSERQERAGASGLLVGRQRAARRSDLLAVLYCLFPDPHCDNALSLGLGGQRGWFASCSLSEWVVYRVGILKKHPAYFRR